MVKSLYIFTRSIKAMFCSFCPIHKTLLIHILLINSSNIQIIQWQ